MVIGGGLIGTCVAYELSIAGLAVTVVEADRAGRASDAGAGIASPQTSLDPDPEWHSFSCAALSHLAELADRVRNDGVSLGAEAFSVCGAVVLALAEHEDPWFEEVAALVLGRHGGVTEIAASDAQALFPPLAHPWRALYSPGSARLDGRLFTRSVREAAARRGVVTVKGDVSRVVPLSGGGVRIEGDGVDRDCATAVLASGAWSRRLAENAGAELPVTPTKGEIVHLALDVADGIAGDSGRWPIVQPILNFYLVPWPGGRVACGGTFTPEAGFDVRPTARGVRDLLRECLTIAPGLGTASMIETRVGLRPTSPDDRPLLGPLPAIGNVHACTGHGANGLLLGPYSAALVAAGITSGRRPEEMAPYDPSRFGV